jgi:TRAP-type C4-dicarboxylate transport system permease small subunit
MEDLPDARRIVGPAASWVALIGAAAIMLMAAAIVIDVLMRWLFNAPILGVDDLGKYNLAVTVASFFPLCLVGGHFVTIRLVGKALGPFRALWLEVLGNLMTLLVFLLLAWQFLRFTIYDVTLTGLATPVLEIPQAPWWWVVTAIIVLCVPIQMFVLYESLLRAIRRTPREFQEKTADAGV